MRRFTERASVLCGAFSCVDSFSSHMSFSSSCTAGYDSSAIVVQQTHHLLNCRSKKRGRWGSMNSSLALSSSDSNEEEKDGDFGLAPLFPELANQAPTQEPSPYDEAADALQKLRRGRPSAGERGERALSASDEIRNAMASNGLEGAAKAIQKAMSKGGDWYEDEAEYSTNKLTGSEDMAAQGMDTDGVVDRNEEGGSALTNLDFLLGRLDANNDK